MTEQARAASGATARNIDIARRKADDARISRSLPILVDVRNGPQADGPRRRFAA
jgi:hypothetical protein